MSNQIKIQTGDILQSKSQTLVNTVNCVGIMGKGLALKFKKTFPGMYKDYVKQCNKGKMKLGEPYLFRQLDSPWVLNFPTKDHWRSASNIDEIMNGLDFLEKHYREWGITSIAFPALGCQNGGLDWRVVMPLLYKRLNMFEISVELYAPRGVTAEELLGIINKNLIEINVTDLGNISEKIKPEWLSLVEILSIIEKNDPHHPVGRIGLEQIAYFAQSQGLPLGLKYRHRDTGINAAAMKKITARLINNGLILEEKLGRTSTIRVGPSYPSSRNLYESELDEWKPINGKVAQLIIDVGSKSARLAASIHFAAAFHEQITGETPTNEDIADQLCKIGRKRRSRPNEDKITLIMQQLIASRFIPLRAADIPCLGMP